MKKQIEPFSLSISRIGISSIMLNKTIQSTFKNAAKKLSGNCKRDFMAKVTEDYFNGSARQAETVLGWCRHVELRERRLSKTLTALNGQKITVIIDETGDRKKGKKTDYVARQYLGSIGKIDNGILKVDGKAL
jgi:DDE superfamily endonuclease